VSADPTTLIMRSASCIEDVVRIENAWGRLHDLIDSLSEIEMSPSSSASLRASVRPVIDQLIDACSTIRRAVAVARASNV